MMVGIAAGAEVSDQAESGVASMVPLLEEVLCDATRPSSLQSQPSLNRECESLASLPEEIVCACGVDVVQLAETLRSLPEEIPGPLARVMSQQTDPAYMADTLRSLPEEILVPSTRTMSREVDPLQREDLEALLEEIPALSPNDFQPMEPHVLIDELLPFDGEPEPSAEVDEESACYRPLTRDTVVTKGVVTPGAETAEDLLFLAASVQEETSVFSPVAYDMAAVDLADIREDIGAATEELLTSAASINEEHGFCNSTVEKAAAPDDVGSTEDIADAAEELLGLGASIKEEPSLGNTNVDQAAVTDDACIREDIVDVADDLLGTAAAADHDAVVELAGVRDEIADAEELPVSAASIKEEPDLGNPITDQVPAADEAGVNEGIVHDAEDLLASAALIRDESVSERRTSDHVGPAVHSGVREDIACAPEDLPTEASSNEHLHVSGTPTVDHAATGDARGCEDIVDAAGGLLTVAASIQDGPMLGNQAVPDGTTVDALDAGEDTTAFEDLLALAESIHEEQACPVVGDVEVAHGAGGRRGIADVDEDRAQSHPAAENVAAVGALRMHEDSDAAHVAVAHQETACFFPVPIDATNVEGMGAANDIVAAHELEALAAAVEDGGNSADDNLQALTTEILEELECVQVPTDDTTHADGVLLHVAEAAPVTSEAVACPVQASKGSDRQRRDSDSRRRAHSTSALSAPVVEPSRRRAGASSAMQRPRSGSPRRLGPDAVMPVMKGVQWKQEEAARKEARDDYLREYMKAHRPTACRSSGPGRPENVMPVLQPEHMNLLEEEYTRSKQASSVHANAKQRAGGRPGYSSAAHGHPKQGPTKVVSPSLQSAGNAIVRPKT